VHTIEISLKNNSYPVYTGTGLLHDTELWDQHLSSGSTLIVSNEIVAPLYLDSLKEALVGRRVDSLILPDGEQHKTISTWSSVVDRLVQMKSRRDGNLIALGGGVIGDIGGFAAASYMRGIRLLQAPTTLLSQVDSSVGGKTGVNHDHGKNLIGAFYQPTAVIADMNTLDSLPEREFRAGLAEVIKYGAIRDQGFFAWLESSVNLIEQRDSKALTFIVQSCVRNKAEIVSQDEFETGVRAILNFGHSFGHALESLTGYSRYLHGEAVSVGMVIAANLSVLRGICDTRSLKRLQNLLSTFKLPVSLPDSVDANDMLKALELDKKSVESGLRLILLNSIGEAVINSISEKGDILSVIRQSQPD
jgi:3-dehydroquinate synthase